MNEDKTTLKDEDKTTEEIKKMDLDIFNDSSYKQLDTLWRPVSVCEAREKEIVDIAKTYMSFLNFKLFKEEIKEKVNSQSCPECNLKKEGLNLNLCPSADTKLTRKKNFTVEDSLAKVDNEASSGQDALNSYYR